MKRSLNPDKHGSAKSPRLLSQTASNKIQDNLANGTNRIKVCVRVRPMSNKEIESGSKRVVDVIDQNNLRFDPHFYELADDQYQYHGKVYKAIGKKSNKNLKFVFDRVFSETEDNLTVYNQTTKDMVSSLLSGYNCSVFAYGSTGSGKTHTMLGSSNDPGVIFFTTMDLYKRMEEEKDRKLEIKISYYEIYNETIYDLLEPNSAPLSVLEDGNKCLSIKNLSVHRPNNANHVLEMLEMGNKNRKQHPTDSNSESSRSHAIFQITLRSKNFSDGQDISIQVSKMNLIDLAGSERATTAYRTFRTKGLHREGGNINKSLLALGNCISALSSNSDCYVPYRSSKLTLLLRDSLGGNCKTLMIATISSSLNQYEEIQNTLLYAIRTKGIKMNATVNSSMACLVPGDYKQMLEAKSRETTELAAKITSLELELEKYKNQVQSIPNDPVYAPTDAVGKLNSVKNVLDDLFQQRIDLRAKLLDCHHNLKFLDLRLLFRTHDNERLEILENLDTEQFSESKTFDGLHSIYAQKLHYSDLKSKIQKQVDENEEKILKLERDLLEKTNNDLVVSSYFQKNHGITQTKDMELLEKHQIKLIEEMCSRYVFYEDLMSDLFNYSYRTYSILNGLGQLSEDMQEKFKMIVQKIKGKKSVVWRDQVDSPTLKKMKDLVNLFSDRLYMNNAPFDSDETTKRTLVAIHDITPLLDRQNSSRAVNSQQHNYLGNTVTKSRRMPNTLPLHNVENQQSTRSYRNNSQRVVGQSTSNFWQSQETKYGRQRRYHQNDNNHDAENMVQNPNGFGPHKFNPRFRPRFRF